jgi:hypothetical protein
MTPHSTPASTSTDARRTVGRHAAPDRDRVGTLRTASWAAMNGAAACLLGMVVHQDHASPAPARAATAPDQPLA